jgi:hypothetical protein
MLSSEAAAAGSRPEGMLKRIDDLRTAGLVDDAKASFKAFRSRYPDYPLPAGPWSLKDLNGHRNCVAPERLTPSSALGPIKVSDHLR